MAQTKNALTHLFAPLKIGDLVLSNRIAMAPLTRGRSTLSRIPTDHMVKYYTQRAEAGLLIAEATAISPQGYGWAQAPGTYTKEMSDGWAKVTNSVHAAGGKIFLQLWHMGRSSHSSFQIDNQQIVAPSAIAIVDDGVYGIDDKKYPREVPRALETSELPGIVGDYTKAAEFAKQAGFDGVEIHAANGYLIDQFLQSCSNKRTDTYGGSIENRYRLLGEIVSAVSSVYPSNRVGVRLSPNGDYGSMGSEDNIETFSFTVEQLAKENLAYIHIIDQLAFGFHNKCAPFTLELARKLAPKDVLVGNAGYTKETAEAAIASGNADMIAFGRPFLSTPDLVHRFKHDLPLNPSSEGSTWFSHEPVAGYIDFPVLERTQ
eukprot:c22971_g2_i1.p1 GENE.c22971_g2_i1~~c22971_g2_i1.p1  ORF type:complete len:387 (+),score=96.20 c22971_g2_i1:41-1162(+)